jgi:DNA polymerase-3 subunit beta
MNSKKGYKMTTIINLKQSTLDAMLLIAGKKDVRYYLNGVSLEWNHEKTRAIGCDGCALGVVSQFIEGNEGEGSIILPRDVIERLPKRPKNDAIVSITCTGVGDSKKWAIVTGGVVINFTPCDAQYPDWRRITHGLKTSGEAAGFNVDYLVAFEKAGVIMGGGKLRVGSRLRLHHNGRDGALVTLDGLPDFAGVVMPLKEQAGSAGALFPWNISGTANPETAAVAVAA